ncbi:hypothetical protein IKG50_03060 [Candidatus Saccharibacteria bacterium]|nr:hypothetical protein [Candidatus Saccharibacteria bacterium]
MRKTIDDLYTELTEKRSSLFNQVLFIRWIVDQLELIAELLAIAAEFDFVDDLPHIPGLVIPEGIEIVPEDFDGAYLSMLDSGMMRLRTGIKRKIELEPRNTLRVIDIFDIGSNGYSETYDIDRQLHEADISINEMKIDIMRRKEYHVPVQFVEEKLEKAVSYYYMLDKLRDISNTVEIERGIERAKDIILRAVAG